jgi:hypothetical protein
MSMAGGPAGPRTSARARWRRLSTLSRILLGLSVLASTGLGVVLGLALYLFIGGYSAGNDPTSPAPLLFPIAIGLFILVGLPAGMLCIVLWTGFAFSLRRKG